MNERLKNIYRKYIIDYIKKVNPETKPNEKKLILCPKNCSKEPTAQIHHNKISCYEPTCNDVFDIFDYVRLTKESCSNKSDEDIADYVKHLLNVKIVDDTDQLLERYAEAGFCLIPLASGTKIPPKGFKWRDNLYKNPKIWKDWIERGWGLGLVLGKDSGIIAVDIDHDDTYEKIKHLLGVTLTQSTQRGSHYVYSYDPEIKKTLNSVLRKAGYEMEYRTDGAYTVIAPTSVEGEIREWNTEKIVEMPKELKDFFLKYYKEDEKICDNDEIQDAIDNEKISVVDLKGKRNDTFLKTAGIFSKWMAPEIVLKTLNFLSNNWVDKPIAKGELYAMMNQIKGYRTFDKEKLAKEVLDRLDIIKEATAFQIAGSLKYDIKNVEDVLKYLEDQGKIYNTGNRKYQKINKVKWVTGSQTNDVSTPINFEIPMVTKYARIDYGNIIIIGAQSGCGKTHITANFVKAFVDQGITPHVLNTEAGSKIINLCSHLKVDPNKYFIPEIIPQQATDIELEPNAITILDWLSPRDGNFAEMGNTLAYFHNQLKKYNGLLIVLMQLRSSNSEWYAQDLVLWYGSFVAKYLFGDGGKDSLNTYLKTEKIRDSRTNQQRIDIPLYFDRTTKLISER